MLRRFSIFASLAVFAAALTFGSAPARAQCMPDNLDSLPCCTPVGVTLPAFPAAGGSSKFICFRDCQTQLNQNLCVSILAPRVAISGGPVCGVYTITFRITTCGGAAQSLWQGTMRAQYVRNWLENPASGQIGVWRFLVNGDLKATPLLQSNPGWANPNVQPACYSTFNAIYVSGYIDYAFDCSNNTWSVAWALNHDCDSNHHPAGSPRAGAFHPNRSWTFVGPAAGFVVDPVGAVVAAGTSTAVEAFRWNDWSTVPGICRAEELNNGVFVSMGSVCPCGVGPGQYDDTLVSVAGFCLPTGTTMRTLLLPAPQLRQKRIGRWTNALVFPGTEELSLSMGDMTYTNACTGINTIEWFEGVATVGGFPAQQYAPPALGTQFVDLGSCNRSPTNMSRRVGVPHVTQYIASVDIP